jgi:hypothetical protein
VEELLAIPKARVWSMSRRGDIPTVRTGPREALSPGGHRHLDRPAHDLTASRHAIVSRPFRHGCDPPARPLVRAFHVSRAVIAKHRAETEAGLEFGVQRVAGADCGHSVVAAASARKKGCLSVAELSILCSARAAPNAIMPFLDGAIVAHGIGLGAGLKTGAERDAAAVDQRV